MSPRELEVPGAWVFAPPVHLGAGATFVEAFAADTFATTLPTGLSLGQLNLSVLERGTLRGIHFGPSQAKFVTCAVGAVWDVVVDLRPDSSTYGSWDAVLLDDVSRRAVYLSEGLGHGYLCLEEGSVLVYVCSEPYVRGREHRMDAMSLSIDWPTVGRDGTTLEWRRGKLDSAAPAFGRELPHTCDSRREAQGPRDPGTRPPAA